MRYNIEGGTRGMADIVFNLKRFWKGPFKAGAGPRSENV